jgi:hypothetical protein
MKSQRLRDTCAVFTVTSALEYALSKNFDEGVRLSEEYLNWAANETTNQYQDGATFAELQKGFAKWGIAEEAAMPYARSFNAAAVPSHAALEGARQIWEMKPKWNWIERGSDGLNDAHLEKIKATLRRGFPVCAGGEHCMLLVGYSEDWQNGTGYFTARNFATRRYERITYDQTQARFESLLWIELPQAKG